MSGSQAEPLVPSAGLWRAQPCDLSAAEWADVRPEAGSIVCFDKGEIVTEVVAVVFGDGQAQRDARAAFIVSACNSHYDLVEALEECARRLRRATIAGGTDPEFADIAVEKYTALIARATGGDA